MIVKISKTVLRLSITTPTTIYDNDNDDKLYCYEDGDDNDIDGDSDDDDDYHNYDDNDDDDKDDGDDSDKKVDDKCYCPLLLLSQTVFHVGIYFTGINDVCFYGSPLLCGTQTVWNSEGQKLTLIQMPRKSCISHPSVG